MQSKDSRFDLLLIKKAGILSIPQDPLDKGTAINKSCLYAQCPKTLIHTKLDCPSAV